MHSKVIIASLVIALAAGFNSGGKIASSPKKTAVDTSGSISCAPNYTNKELFDLFKK